MNKRDAVVVFVLFSVFSLFLASTVYAEEGKKSCKWYDVFCRFRSLIPLSVIEGVSKEINLGTGNSFNVDLSSFIVSPKEQLIPGASFSLYSDCNGRMWGGGCPILEGDVCYFTVNGVKVSNSLNPSYSSFPSIMNGWYKLPITINSLKFTLGLPSVCNAILAIEYRMPDCVIRSEEAFGNVPALSSGATTLGYICPQGEDFDKCQVFMQRYVPSDNAWSNMGGINQLLEKDQATSISFQEGYIYDRRGLAQKLTCLKGCSDGSINYRGNCQTTIPPETNTSCGNNICDGGETIASCQEDCQEKILPPILGLPELPWWSKIWEWVRRNFLGL